MGPSYSRTCAVRLVHPTRTPPRTPRYGGLRHVTSHGIASELWVDKHPRNDQFFARCMHWRDLAADLDLTKQPSNMSHCCHDHQPRNGRGAGWALPTGRHVDHLSTRKPTRKPHNQYASHGCWAPGQVTSDTRGTTRTVASLKLEVVLVTSYVILRYEQRPTSSQIT